MKTLKWLVDIAFCLSVSYLFSNAQPITIFIISVRFASFFKTHRKIIWRVACILKYIISSFVSNTRHSKIFIISLRFASFFKIHRKIIWRVACILKYIISSFVSNTRHSKIFIISLRFASFFKIHRQNSPENFPTARKNSVEHFKALMNFFELTLVFLGLLHVIICSSRRRVLTFKQRVVRVPFETKRCAMQLSKCWKQLI